MGGKTSQAVIWKVEARPFLFVFSWVLVSSEERELCSAPPAERAGLSADVSQIFQ